MKFQKILKSLLLVIRGRNNFSFKCRYAVVTRPSKSGLKDSNTARTTFTGTAATSVLSPTPADIFL